MGGMKSVLAYLAATAVMWAGFVLLVSQSASAGWQINVGAIIGVLGFVAGWGLLIYVVCRYRTRP
jgi:hypothetical protein